MGKYDKFINVFIILIIVFLLYKLLSCSQLFANNEGFDLIKNGKMKKSKGSNTIKMANPSGSDYVLEQKSNKGNKKNTDSNTFYEVAIEVTPNLSYRVSCWYCGTGDWDGKDNIINVLMIKKDGSNYIPACNIKIRQTMTYEGNKWNYISTTFKVPKDVKKDASIYLGYKPHATKGIRYIADLSVAIDIPGVSNLPQSNYLTSMIVASNKNSYDISSSNYKKDNTEVYDLTGLGHNFKFTTKPVFNNDYFTFNSNTGYLMGPLISQLFPNYNSNNFTLISRFHSSGTNDSSYGTLFKIHGSGGLGKKDVSLQLDIPNNSGQIKLNIGGLDLVSKDSYHTTNDIIYTLSVNNNSPTLYLYTIGQNNQCSNTNPMIVEFKYSDPLFAEQVIQHNKLYFDFKKVFSMNNPNKLNGYLYSVLVFKKSLDKNVVCNISKKLADMKSNKFDTGGRPDMNEHFFDNGLNNSLTENFTNIRENMANDDTSKLYCKDDQFKRDFENSSGGTKHHDAKKRNRKRNSKRCNEVCQDECRPYRKRGTTKQDGKEYYQSCLESCKEERIECGNTWPDGSRDKNWPDDDRHGGRHGSGRHGSGRHGSGRHGGGRHGDGRHGSGRHGGHGRCNNRHHSDGECPIAYMKNGKYIVYIPKNSKGARELGKHGEFDYGKKRHHAKRIYESNFPDCPVPEILDDNANNPTLDSCPFIVREHNPCYSRACRDTDWSKWDSGDITKCKMKSKCKGLVDNYCKMYNQIDPACECWDPSMKDDPKCAKFRNYFNTGDNCSPSQFDINDHPDIGKYIRRDNIPCWNCDLDNAKDVKVKRKY